MMRGCQKKIIILKNTGSRIFDEAYFILNDDAAISGSVTHSDMVNEANRIIASAACGMDREDEAAERRRLWQIFLWFTTGAVCSAAATVLILLL